MIITSTSMRRRICGSWERSSLGLGGWSEEWTGCYWITVSGWEFKSVEGMRVGVYAVRQDGPRYTSTMTDVISRWLYTRNASSSTAKLWKSSRWLYKADTVCKGDGRYRRGRFEDADGGWRREAGYHGRAGYEGQVGRQGRLTRRTVPSDSYRMSRVSLATHHPSAS
jgi:hypothetical protein